MVAVPSRTQTPPPSAVWDVLPEIVAFRTVSDVSDQMPPPDWMDVLSLTSLPSLRVRAALLVMPPPPFLLVVLPTTWTPESVTVESLLS